MNEVALEERNEGVTYVIVSSVESRTEGVAVEWMERGFLQVGGVTAVVGPVACVADWINDQVEPQRLDELRWDVTPVK